MYFNRHSQQLWTQINDIRQENEKIIQDMLRIWYVFLWLLQFWLVFPRFSYLFLQVTVSRDEKCFVKLSKKFGQFNGQFPRQKSQNGFSVPSNQRHFKCSFEWLQKFDGKNQRFRRCISQNSSSKFVD